MKELDETKQTIDLEGEFRDVVEYVMRTPIELLGDALDINPEIPRGKDFTTNFSIGNYKYKYEGYLSIMENDKTKMEFKFYLLNGKNQPKREKFATDQQYDIALKHYQTSVTGESSNKFKVFSRVLSFTAGYLNEYSPDYLVFVANEENRQSLYAKCMDKMFNHTKDKYKRINVDPEMNYALGPENFWYEKEKI